jgi:plasmid stabilization system protein ParE
VSLPVVITDLAEVDLRSCYRWLAERNRAAADRWRDSLLAAVDSLGENPERWPLATEPELAELGIRELHHGKRRRIHRVFYHIGSDSVEILRVRHAAQDSLSPGDMWQADEE